MMTITAAATTAAKPLVDWVTLLQAIGLSVAIGIGIVVVTSIAVRLRSTAERTQGAERSLSLIGSWVAVGLVILAIIGGLYLLMHKG